MLKLVLTFLSILWTINVFLHQVCGLCVADHNSNVLPRSGAPVRVVIAFLGYLQAPSCSTRVLSRVNRQITFKFLVSGKQTCGVSKLSC